MELIDIHCHILPGLDDGPETMEETLETLREYVRQGIGTVIATPHHHPERYVVEPEAIFQVIEEVQEQCKKEGIEIKILPGQENLYYSELVTKLENAKTLTLARNRHVLVEFNTECSYSYLKNSLQELITSGYIPVLAHFERYDCLKKEEQLIQLKDMGVKLQMNYDTLLIKDRFFFKNKWREYVKEDLVDFLASDCHGIEFRPLHAKQAMEVLKKILMEEQIQRILYENPQQLLR